MDVNREVSKKQTSSVDEHSNRHFRSFSWLKEEHRTPETNLLELAKDVASGVGLVVELLERASLDHGDGSGAYLPVPDQGTLERFAIAACTMLHDTIAEHFDYIEERASKEGK